MFKNRVRLPFYLKQPQWPTERSVFRKSDGTTKVLSIVIRNTFQGVTDQKTKEFHEKLVIALSHDDVTVEGDRLDSGVVLSGDYQVEWNDFIDNPLGIGQFQVEVTPYDVTNDNCQTCEEAAQLDLEDDTFPYALDEGEEGCIAVFENDSICCSPIVAEIVWYDPAFIDSANINLYGNGLLCLTVKNPSPSGTNVKLATYRVTCPNGGFDEADVYGSIEGSAPSCEVPSNLVYDPDAEEVTFDPSPSAPADGYDYYIWDCNDLANHIFAGNVAASPIALGPANLAPGGCYIIGIRAVCNQDINYSEQVNLEFNVPGQPTLCGSFIIQNNDPFGPVPVIPVTYMDCNGVLQNINVRTPRTICALTNSISGAIYYIQFSEGDLGITPNGDCA